MEVFGIEAKNVTAIVFLAGVLACIIAVSAPNYTNLTPQVWDVPSNRERLEVIANNQGAWRWSSAWWAAGSILNAIAFGLVAVLLRQNGEALLGEITMLCFLLGAFLWLVAMAYRMGVEPLVTDAAQAADDLPGWFKPVEAWSLNIMLFYLIMAYTAIAILGWGLLRTELVPGWIGWFSLAFGSAAALSMTFSFPRLPGTEYSIFGLPILPHLPPLIIGIALLVGR